MSKSGYIRDGRSPLPESEKTSRVMSANRGTNTGPELELRRALRELGVRGYRLHWGKAPGRPDIAFPGRRKAIFVNGCFWHRCPRCNPSFPRTHVRYWKEKFERNKRRDEMKSRALTDLGWDVATVWECEIRSDTKATAMKIREWVHSGDRL